MVAPFGSHLGSVILANAEQSGGAMRQRSLTVRNSNPDAKSCRPNLLSLIGKDEINVGQLSRKEFQSTELAIDQFPRLRWGRVTYLSGPKLTFTVISIAASQLCHF